MLSGTQTLSVKPSAPQLAVTCTLFVKESLLYAEVSNMRQASARTQLLLLQSMPASPLLQSHLPQQ